MIFSPEFTARELAIITNALRLSASSCERLAKRDGQSDKAAAAYRDEATDVRALMFKLTHLDGKV